MSKAVSTEARSVSEAGRAWRREMDQWQAALQRCLTESLAEVRDLIQAIESQASQESVTRAGKTTASLSTAASVQLSSVVPGGKLQKGVGAAGNSQQLSERIDGSLDENDSFVTSPPKEVAAGTQTSDHRLAQLARQLEEKLERSNSRVNDAGP